MSLLYLDIETTGLDPLTSELVTLQLMTSSGKTIIVKDPESLEALKPKLENNLIVGHNIKFDSKFLKYHYGITLYNVYDTQLAEIIISGGRYAGKKDTTRIEDVVFRYCGVTLDKDEDLRKSFKRGDSLTRKQTEYALNDIRYLPEVMRQQQAKIKSLGLENIIDIEMKAVPAFVWLELSGIYLDLNILEEIRNNSLAKKEEAKLFLLEELITYDKQYTLENKPIPRIPDLDSNPELLAALQAKGFDLKDTSDLERSKYIGDPIIKALKQYREANKRLTSFIQTYPEFINPVTDRMHSNFNQCGARSGRLTSSKPNMQQQPHTNDWRRIYTAAPGHKIVSADYSQIELRILGQVSGDKEFLRAYNSSIDLHRLTASKVFNTPLDEVTDEQRNKAKPVNFGIAYGMWTKGLIGNLRKSGITISEKEAEDIINGFYKAYPGVAKYLRNASISGLRNLEVRTLAGRLLKFDPPKSDKEEGSIKRQSRDLPIQGLCADMLKMALGTLFLMLEPRGVKFINTVHDEVVFECKVEEVDEIAGIIKSEMEKTGSLFLKDLPCEAKITIADFWKKE